MLALRSTPFRRRTSAALLAAPALALALAACGTTAPPTGSPAASSASAGGGSGSSTGGASAERDAYDLELAQCLRSRGLDVADPAPGAGIQESGPEVQAAAAACMAEIGEPPTRDFSDEELRAMHEGGLALAECLRELGHDVSDPEVGAPLALDGVPDADFADCTTPAE
ncbi:hypothetical protein [Modestobacter sp. SYSU DS0511]